ncbi:hypothetical protein TP51_003032 [Salmonella enterica subsp. enterica]|nr:hypothetical protein [Salmonella enterica subsp. enterica serovar Rubislaw]EEA7823043.1 hypothetical protein [Salmonella enterica subsp. enterica serovar Miami]
MSKFKALVATAALAVLSVSSAFAADTGPDYTTISSSVDFGTTVSAVMSVGAGAIVLLMAMVGLKKVFLFVKSI